MKEYVRRGSILSSHSILAKFRLAIRKGFNSVVSFKGSSISSHQSTEAKSNWLLKSASTTSLYSKEANSGRLLKSNLIAARHDIGSYVSQWIRLMIKGFQSIDSPFDAFIAQLSSPINTKK